MYYATQKSEGICKFLEETYANLKKRGMVDAVDMGDFVYMALSLLDTVIRARKTKEVADLLGGIPLTKEVVYS